MFARVFLSVLVSAAAALAPTSPALARDLESRVRAALSGARLGSAQVGVSVYDVTRNAEVVDIKAGGKAALEKGFIPASNLKLLTSGAALCILGKDFEFRTTLIQDGDRLVVRGMGDPALADPELLDKMGASLNSLLDKLVGMARDAGASGIREVVLDDRVFDREYVHPEWPREQLHQAYCAQVSGINFHGNLLSVYVDPPRSQPEAPWIVIKRATHRVSEGATELRLDREREGGPGSYNFKLSGAVRFNPDGPVQVTVDQSCLILGRLLADRIVRDGLAAPALTAAAMPVRLVGQDERTGDGPECRTVAVVRTPLAVALERCNVDSDNLYAESLLKSCGHKATGQPGSWSNGTAAVRMMLKERLGSDIAAQLIMTDGSGLSRGNRVTPGMITRWLSSLSRDPQLGPAFVSSLPTVGEGTLKKRFKNAKLRCEVRGKSGYIREVRSLSGYVTEPQSGRRMAYSVLINEIPGDGDLKAKEFHETVVKLIDEELAAGGPPEAAKQKTEPRERIGG